MDYSKKCRSKYTPEKWKYINQYYCRSWVSWVGRHTNTAIAEDRNKQRNCNITSEYIMNLLKKQNYLCAVSGIELRHDKSLYSMSIDRLNNKLGHIQGNVQLISRGLNLAKNDGKQENLIDLLDNLMSNSFEPEKKSRDYISSRIRMHKMRDTKHGLDCDISTDMILDLYNRTDGRCYFTNIKMACYKHSCFSISIDRMDNTKGHTIDNVRLVLKSINRAKRDYDDENFSSWLDDIRESYQRKQYGFS